MINMPVQTTTIRKRRVALPLSFTPAARGPRKVVESEETLVRDSRASVRPAEQVESKLRGILRHALVPLSQMRLNDCCGGRSHR